MRDEVAIPGHGPAAWDPAALLGPAHARDFADAAGPTADRAAPTVVVGRSAPPVQGALMDPLDIRALLNPAEQAREHARASGAARLAGDNAPATTTQRERLRVIRTAHRHDHGELPTRDLLSMLTAGPACGYAKISATLGVAVGSIGPMRAPWLAWPRRSLHLASHADVLAKDTKYKQARWPW